MTFRGVHPLAGVVEWERRKIRVRRVSGHFWIPRYSSSMRRLEESVWHFYMAGVPVNGSIPH